MFSNHHEIMLALIFTSKLPRELGELLKKIIPYVNSHECEMFVFLHPVGRSGDGKIEGFSPPGPALVGKCPVISAPECSEVLQ